MSGREDKLLQAMRQHPLGWTIADIERVCRSAGLACSAPKRGSHYKVSHPQLAEILTIPYKRPIKPVYIRELLKLIDKLEPQT